MNRREDTARGFAEVLWGLVALDAPGTSPQTRDAAVPHLAPGKAPGAPQSNRETGV